MKYVWFHLCNSRIARRKCVFYLVCTHVHVHVENGLGASPPWGDKGSEPALYLGCGLVPARSPDTCPCVTRTIQTNDRDNKKKLE